MATIEESQYSYLVAQSTAAGARFYPNVIPQDATLPAVAYQRIDGPRVMVHSGASGLTFARMQYSCTAATYSAAKALLHQVRAALNGYTGTMGTGGVKVEHCIVKNEVDGYNEVADKQVIRLDVQFFYVET